MWTELEATSSVYCLSELMCCFQNKNFLIWFHNSAFKTLDMPKLSYTSKQKKHELLIALLLF